MSFPTFRKLKAKNHSLRKVSNNDHEESVKSTKKSLQILSFDHVQNYDIYVLTIHIRTKILILLKSAKLNQIKFHPCHLSKKMYLHNLHIH